MGPLANVGIRAGGSNGEVLIIGGNSTIQLRGGGTEDSSGIVEIAKNGNLTAQTGRITANVFTSKQQPSGVDDLTRKDYVDGLLDFVSKARGGEYAKNVHFVEGLSLNARGGSAEFIPGPGDGADYTTVNAKIQTWYGLGFGSSYGTEGVTIVFNLRNGDIKTKGNISVASGKFVIAGQAPTDNAHLTNKKYVDDSASEPCSVVIDSGVRETETPLMVFLVIVTLPVLVTVTGL
ncbi:hypothetical protein vBKpnAMK4_00479 [Klebsiella phage vB_Kpn_AM_K4]